MVERKERKSVEDGQIPNHERKNSERTSREMKMEDLLPPQVCASVV